MAVFENAEVLEKILGGFFRLLSDTPEVADKLIKAKLVIKFHYTEPDLTLTVDCSGDKVEITANDEAKKPTVEMFMKAEIAHKFWYGKVNLTAALARRQMTAKGPIPKIMALLPAIKPAYAMYPKYIDDNGFEKYNIHK
ncbi:MAG: SCP2 sterol-binding domain-containing protein [Deltaproteobacteria bacterium]|nr:SCP2 sterol-binding domain-containing protein [Deltaproteobacteria bacterium]